MITQANGRATTTLFPQHLAELTEGSGLSPEMIAEAGIYSSDDVAQNAAMLNRKTWSQKLGDALVFPYFDEWGGTPLRRLKPDNPQLNQSTGKKAKYLQPTGAPTRLYVPKRVYKLFDDESSRLLITEGEKKALKATQEGFNCVGLCGVDNWHGRKRTSLSADLDRIKWNGREVYIAFDSDAETNEHVERNVRLLAAALLSRGAKAKVVRIPTGNDGEKQGIDDFIVAHGPAAFEQLLLKAEKPEPVDSGDIKLPAKDADPAKEADALLAGVKIGELSRLRFYRGVPHWWANGRYAERPIEEVRAEIVNALNVRLCGVKSRVVSDVMEHVKAKAMLSSSLEPPCWLGSAPNNWPADECLATKNAVVHLPSLIDGKQPCEIPATPAFLATNATDFALDLNAPRPSHWLQFLDELWHDDPQSIAALQQWFGYSLVPDTSYQKGFIAVGPPRSGKGTIARVLTQLVGRGNIASPTLAGMGTNFGLWPLIGKSLAIISDARLSGRADQVAVVERILSITGEDSITIDRKNLTPLTLRLPTRFMILTNELPRLSDASGAIVSRFIMVRTTRSWLGKEDRELTNRLLEELPGILLWAIQGWQQLRQQGRFIQPDSSIDAMREMADLASPIGAFIRDVCVVGPAESATPSELFDAWRKWCESQGREKMVGTLATFSRDLLAAEPLLQKKRLREGDDRHRVYMGIGLRNQF